MSKGKWLPKKANRMASLIIYPVLSGHLAVLPVAKDGNGEGVLKQSAKLVPAPGKLAVAQLESHLV